MGFLDPASYTGSNSSGGDYYGTAKAMMQKMFGSSGAVSSLLDQFQSGQSGFNASNKLIQQNLSGANLDVNNNPYIQGIAQNATQQMNQNLAQNLAGIQSQYAKSGLNFSGPESQAANQATATANTGLSGQLLNMYSNQYNTNLSNQQAAIGQAQSAYAMPMQLATQAMGAGRQGTTSQSGFGSK